MTPFAQAAGALIALGYHPLPVQPLAKAPGEYRHGAWRGMSAWQRFRDRAPSPLELQIWENNYPDANIGMVLGSPCQDDLHLIAIDIDAEDPVAVQAITAALPPSPMRKMGAKGQTLFYRAAKSLRSRAYNADGIRLVDVLTGFDTRQTVVPPSVHPSGAAYRWLDGPVAAADLPEFTADDLDWLEGMLATFGWSPDPVRAPRLTTAHSAAAPGYAPGGEASDYFSETKAAALANLSAWVPALGLYGLRAARGGYEAVATWRPSATGRPLEARERNLSIHPHGISDFGDGPKGYTAIDLVMAAFGWEQAAATGWLRERLGLGDVGVTIALQPPATLISSPAPLGVGEGDHAVVEGAGAARNIAGRTTQGPLNIHSGAVPHGPAPSTANAVPLPHASGHGGGESAPKPPPELQELPTALTQVPGLLGELTEWICATARRPQRGLALGAALTLLGTAAGRTYAGPTRSATHLYVLALARTGAGKDHALDQITRLLQTCGLNTYLGASQFMSQQAVFGLMHRKPCSLCPMDEFGAFMRRINNAKPGGHDSQISALLRTAWGASFKTIPAPEWSGKELDPIQSPALSIYGASVPDEFYRSLTGADVSNGLMNRFLLLSTRRKPRAREPKRDPYLVPETLKEGLAAIHGAGPALSRASQHNARADGPLITAVWGDDEAKALFEAFERECDDLEEDHPLIGRTAEIAIRLAAIRAIGQNPAAPAIYLADMQWGADLARWSFTRMEAETADHIADTQNQADSQLVLRKIKERGRVKHGDLLLALRHQLKAKDVKEIIGALAEAGQIVVERVIPAMGGMVVTWYRVGRA